MDKLFYYIEDVIASFANIHPVYGGIRDLLNVSHLPRPLDQASSQFCSIRYFVVVVVVIFIVIVLKKFLVDVSVVK